MLILIALAIIAYLLWRIYRQREDEKIDEVTREVREEERKAWERKYPNLIDNVDFTLLRVLDLQVEGGAPLLKLAWLLYVGGSTKIENF